MALKLEGWFEGEFGLSTFKIYEEKHGSHVNLIIEEDGSIRDDVSYHEWLQELASASSSADVVYYKSKSAYQEGKATSFKSFTAKVEKAFPSE